MIDTEDGSSTKNDKPTVGFIGLGLMGSAFTERLVKQGYRTLGHDRMADKVQIAERNGVENGESAENITAQSAQVHICVMTSDDLESAVFGPNGISSSDGSGKILVDHSTTRVETTREFARLLKERNGMDWIDAPVSGGPPAARNGTLAIMAGGNQEAMAKAMPILNDLGQCTHMGDIGAGQATKMVNQILVLNNYCILAEALTLAEAGGVDASKIPQALAQGYAGSNLLQHIFPRMIERDYAPAGYAFQVVKDLQMVSELAQSLEVEIPMSKQSAALFKELVDNGRGELDGIAVLELYQKKE